MPNLKKEEIKRYVSIFNPLFIFKEMVFCSKCGTETLEEKGFCGNCGAPLNHSKIRDSYIRTRRIDPSLLIGVFIIIIGLTFSFGINFGRIIGSWGENFGENMGSWGESFGKYFSEWGSSVSRTIGSYVLIFIGLIIIAYQYGKIRL